jgi:hypothetical protein
MANESATFDPAWEYWTDAWQRSALFLDTLRERGNNYHERAEQDVPHVLDFPVELVRDGRTLAGRSTICSSGSCRPPALASIRPSRQSSSSIRAPDMGLESEA